jgi:hypothetical protein
MSFNRNFFLFICSFGSLAHSQVSVLPDQSNISYTGRFSFNDPINPAFSMSASSIKINFEGTKADGRFSSEGGSSYLYIIVDGDANPYDRKVLEISDVNESQYKLADNLSEGIHTLELVKLNESDTKITFHGLIISGKGLVTKPKRPLLQFEFIGDSNTSGWSAWDAYDKGGNEASGAYYTFPGITSRMLNAEYSLIGASGSGVANRTSWNLTKFYDRIHLKDEISDFNTWNFKNNYWNFEPDAIIVNLGANDYYAKTPKQEIKTCWKNFITNQLRKHYPNSHIVLANSYGWAYGEPADYVHEAIEELRASGDDNISFVRFPWLWGQSHAVINEHAGFANILAFHLAKVLNLPKPELSPLSSMVKKGELKNGGFEKSILPGIADGWRPNGANELIKNEYEAFTGAHFMRLKNGGWLNFATQVDQGMILNLSAYIKSENENSSGFLKIVFKDQGQKTVKTQQIRPDTSKEWELYSASVKVPEGVWSAWIVIEADENSVVDFDDLSLKVLTSN